MKVPKRLETQHGMTLRSGTKKDDQSNRSKHSRVKKTTGDIVSKRVRIFDGNDEEEEATINIVHAENNEDKEINDPSYFFSLNEATVNRLYKGMEKNKV